MLVGIAGSSGLIGTALTARLAAEGHNVRPFVRGPRGSPGVLWDPASGWLDPHALDGLEAIVNLAGASIGAGRWSPARKRLLVSSRIDSTRLLVSGLSKLPSPPALVSISAVGYYGDRGNEVLDESSPDGAGFLAGLASGWEAEAGKARGAGARTVILRAGVVLAANGGALPRLVLPFKLGLGGRLGSGRQWMSWVTLDDLVAGIIAALTSQMSGVYTLTAPGPVTNRDLTKALGRVLRRPAVFPVPRLALRIVAGEAADELLLYSQRVLPRRLVDDGFVFRHPEIESALRAILGRRP